MCSMNSQVFFYLFRGALLDDGCHFDSILHFFLPVFRILKIISRTAAKKTKGTRLSTNLLKNDLPWMKPLEVDDSQDEVKEGGDNDEDGQLPAQPGQQVEGLVLLGKGPNVVAESQVLFTHVGR